jgi:long-chain acyl-CoA synthetase
MNLALWLERAGKSHPASPAVGFGDRMVLDYGALAARAARLGSALRTNCKLVSGDRVAIVAKNCVAYLEALYGIWHAGLAAVLVNAKLHGAEIGYILEHSGARACFVAPELDPQTAAFAPKSLERMIVIGSSDYERLFAADAMAAVARAPQDLAWLFYTSGTTGRPKGAMLTHRVLSALSHAYAAEVDPVMPGDAILHAAPMSHGSGLYIMAHVARLGTHVIPESAGFEPAEVFRLFRRWPRTSMFAAPTMINRLVDAGSDCDPNNIRSIIWGGAPMYVEDTLRALDRFGPRLVQIYGQGESPMTITTLSKEDIAQRSDPRWQAKLASAGRPFACVEVIVADAEDRALPSGEMGEILCRGCSDARILARSESIRRHLAKWLAAHGGRRRLRRLWIFGTQGSVQGRHHQRRFQHLPARGGGGASQASPRARGFRDRAAGPRMGRDRRGLCRWRCSEQRAGQALP